MTQTVGSWSATEANELRELLGCKPEIFAQRLKIHKRTVIRWRQAETDPAPALWKDLDKLLVETVRKRAPWLAPDQIHTMQRRDLLKLLAASSAVPLGGLDVLWTGSFSRVSNTSLAGLEAISTVLAGTYQTSPSHLLINPVMGHLEKASGLLRCGSMQPSQRQRLESIVADAAFFVGCLSLQSGKLAQADAHFGLAEKMARQASNMTLLAQALADQAVLHWYSQRPDQASNDPHTRLRLLEQAQALATRHAPGVVQMAINGWLAEASAEAHNEQRAQHALERTQWALDKALEEGQVGTGFCSSTGAYNGWHQGRLEGFRGAVELSLNRPSAVSTIETSLSLKTNPRWRASGLADLAIALTACKQPEEACSCLIEAHTISLAQGSVSALHHVFSARALMPPEWNPLRCMRELDERLRTTGM